MSTSNLSLFLFSAILALVFAIGAVTLKNALRAAVSLLGHVVSLAGVYLSLHAQLLSAIQVLVYAGAVVVIFVFVIMLIGPDALVTKGPSRGSMVRWMGAALLGMVALALAGIVGGIENPQGGVIAACTTPECLPFGGVEAVAKAIYLEASVPFEMLSILLTVAVVAAIAVAKGHSAEEKRRLEAKHKAEQGTGVHNVRPVSAEVTAKS